MTKHFWESIALVFGAILVCSPATRLLAEDNRSGPAGLEISKVWGQARLSDDQSNMSELDKGRVLGSGSIIQTSARSKVRVRVLENAAQILLEPNTMLKIEDASPAERNGKCSFALLVGKLSVRVPKASEQFKLVFSVPSAKVESSGRGSFELNASGRLKVKAGQVVIDHGSSQSALGRETICAPSAITRDPIVKRNVGIGFTQW